MLCFKRIRNGHASRWRMEIGLHKKHRRLCQCSRQGCLLSEPSLIIKTAEIWRVRSMCFNIFEISFSDWCSQQLRNSWSWRVSFCFECSRQDKFFWGISVWQLPSGTDKLLIYPFIRLCWWVKSGHHVANNVQNICLVPNTFFGYTKCISSKMYWIWNKYTQIYTGNV